MANSGSKLLHMYMYIDKGGIESLYAQTVQRLETEFKKSNEQNRGRKGTIRGGLSPLFGAEAELNAGNKQVIEEKSLLTVEHKLAALLEYLTRGQNQQYHTDLARAATIAESSGKGVFVYFEETFNLPQFYLYADGVEQVNSSGVVEFEIGPLRGQDSYNYSDQYYQRKKQYVFSMNASLSKFPGCRNERMGAISHEAIYFRDYGGKSVPLGVFGYLTHITKLSFYIKPLAIWR